MVAHREPHPVEVDLKLAFRVYSTSAAYLHPRPHPHGDDLALEEDGQAGPDAWKPLIKVSLGNRSMRGENELL